MTFQLSLPNGARLRLNEINCVLFAFSNAERNKKDTGLFPTRHLG
jgi:hypothetical protein